MFSSPFLNSSGSDRQIKQTNKYRKTLKWLYERFPSIAIASQFPKLDSCFVKLTLIIIIKIRNTFVRNWSNSYWQKITNYTRLILGTIKKIIELCNAVLYFTLAKFCCRLQIKSHLDFWLLLFFNSEQKLTLNLPKKS